MTEEELIGKLEMIQRMKSESNILELKSAEKGCPQHLYDSLSSFSNQDEGGIIIFGIDEKQDYKEVGVYDPQDIQKKTARKSIRLPNDLFFYLSLNADTSCVVHNHEMIVCFKLIRTTHTFFTRAYVNTFLSSPALRGYDARIY